MKFTDKTAQAKTQRTITKDGFLVVPATISKVGVFDYLATELGLEEEGIKKVARTEKSLFGDETIKSFENATLTIGHPEDGVNAKNWKQLSVGVVRNVKRVGDELTAEAWIYDENAIKTVQEQGVEQLSCGYDCDIKPSTVQDADFEMSPMIGNHVAIVAKGRCGGGVKLADEDKTIMGKTAKFLDAFLGAFGIKLSDEQKKQIEDEDEEKKGKDGEGKPEGEKKPTEPKNDESDPKKEKEDNVDKEEYEKKLAAKDAEIQQLKDAQAKQEADAKKAAVLADAQTVFKDVKFADNATVREIQESAVVAQGIFTKDEAAKLSDAEISGAYQTAKAVVAKLADERKSLGSILLGDAAPNKAAPTIDFNKTYNS
ncbi:hypothetical protein CQR79_05275 [Aggregatibacter actinomycetemcomitans]|uniref:DUF2213 domain-containing protein n=1 Tax=Aggregatibacter actinomycetemcomitans TaxID=714 RepID=A0A2G1DQM2_AGGAC|nr:DUF2213 domain-containing protein [Aggregatibacter actinomycetemcomitans]PHO20807.1 hypothetical protein CQR80_04755 [Aggregatibacter actinomycetemcomitans]PHO22954.1 hypothetical protein CQR79_05275 [Aggregatibacter actinomycetemcomitans]